MAKANGKNIQTGVVTLKYLHLTTPDVQFNPGNPDYNLTFVMPPAEGKKFIADVEELMPEFKGKVPNKRDDDDNFIFKAKQRQFIEWKDKDTGEQKRMEFKPVILNSDNTPYTGAEPWGGSTGEVAISLRTTKSPQGKPMLALSLKGVRLHDVTVGGDGGGSEGGNPLFGPSVTPVGKTVVEVEGDFEDDVPFN